MVDRADGSKFCTWESAIQMYLSRHPRARAWWGWDEALQRATQVWALVSDFIKIQPKGYTAANLSKPSSPFFWKVAILHFRLLLLGEQPSELTWHLHCSDIISYPPIMGKPASVRGKLCSWVTIDVHLHYGGWTCRPGHWVGSHGTHRIREAENTSFLNFFITQ